MSSTVTTGRKNEDEAAAMLRERGYEIVERNYRCALGEIDIVARDGDELVFVEVRSRADDSRGTAAETVGAKKQRRLARVAEHYISERAPEFETCRFDVVAITGDQVELIRDAFRPGFPG